MTPHPSSPGSTTPRSPGTFRRWLPFALGAGAATAGLALVFAADPAASRWYPHCPFHLLTGYACPGCGALRALHQLLHGHLRAAARLNALALVVGPYLAFELAVSGVQAATGRSGRAPHLPAAWLRALVVLTLAFGVLRNLPFAPFTLLRP
jgi:hypothetical protein